MNRERERMRRLLAFLYSTPSYKPTLIRLGLPELFDRLRELTQAQRWDRLSAVMTDDVLDTLLVCGDYAALPGLLRERYDGLAEGVVMAAPADDGADDRLRKAIEELRSN